mgnify:FL=1
MPHPSYDVIHPDRNLSCVVFASPHSGRNYSASFLNSTVLDDHTIRSSEDAFVDVLFNAAPHSGAPLLMPGAPSS